MSVWGEMLNRSTGDAMRKEDKIAKDKIAKLGNAGIYKKILDEHYPSNDTWEKLYSCDDFEPIHLDKEYIKDIDDFKWDRNRHSRVGDYYIIDHFSLL